MGHAYHLDKAKGSLLGQLRSALGASTHDTFKGYDVHNIRFQAGARRDGMPIVSDDSQITQYSRNLFVIRDSAAQAGGGGGGRNHAQAKVQRKREPTEPLGGNVYDALEKEQSGVWSDSGKYTKISSALIASCTELDPDAFKDMGSAYEEYLRLFKLKVATMSRQVWREDRSDTDLVDDVGAYMETPPGRKHLEPLFALVKKLSKRLSKDGRSPSVVDLLSSEDDGDSGSPASIGQKLPTARQQGEPSAVRSGPARSPAVPKVPQEPTEPTHYLNTTYRCPVFKVVLRMGEAITAQRTAMSVEGNVQLTLVEAYREVPTAQQGPLRLWVPSDLLEEPEGREPWQPPKKAPLPQPPVPLLSSQPSEYFGPPLSAP
ncbi:hypothetical protein GPECTOR_1047g322 [Gonium pectorale]|uniref:Uncharacterized protein n=1 Tax=Gonium pectorale TaxID=33097 RepID=A0A150FTS9_GONPE|nr:hypothetical protein GPECTOR_1047g322 [Gonium pectorale]|eukprot:KXZ40986.1 hypothetical protein GPECTOR_1047g322 [Gonium pectorale]